MEAYVSTSQVEKARALITDGIEHSGKYAGTYRAMQTLLPK